MSPVITVSIIALWIIVLFNLLLTLALIKKVNSMGAPPQESLSVGSPAPPFSAETLDHKTVSLASFAGKPITLIFFSTQCKPCRALLPEIEKLAPKAKKSGTDLILVSADSREETSQFVEELGLSLLVIVAPRSSNPFHDDYKVIGTPYFCLVNGHGIVEQVGFPSHTMPEWNMLVAKWDSSQ